MSQKDFGESVCPKTLTILLPVGALHRQDIGGEAVLAIFILQCSSLDILGAAGNAENNRTVFEDVLRDN